eukprot:1819912-Rhodomonas_salina.1
MAQNQVDSLLLPILVLVMRCDSPQSALVVPQFTLRADVPPLASASQPEIIAVPVLLQDQLNPLQPDQQQVFDDNGVSSRASLTTLSAVSPFGCPSDHLSKESTAHKGSSAEQQQHKKLLADRRALAAESKKQAGLKPPLRPRSVANAARAILEEADGSVSGLPGPLASVA